MTLGVLDILVLQGFDSTWRAKLVRHQSSKPPVRELLRNNWLYQSYQSKPVFRDIDHIVSLYGLRGTRAGFYGVYRVLRVRPAAERSSIWR